MDETLGKRIIAGRKRLGMTQDRLAEQLGVTAQAVSKWENDQSCPDITMLPKLAELFGISIDALLGREKQESVHVAEVVESAAGDEDNHTDSGILCSADRDLTLQAAVAVNNQFFFYLYISSPM